MNASSAPTQRGPKRRLSLDLIAETAQGIVDDEGFAALSLRSVARHLGVTPMALYTYVDSRDALVALVIERLIAEKSRGVTWPTSWEATLRTLASELGDLVAEHPALIEAYAEGAVRTEGAVEVTERVLSRLRESGFTAEQTGRAYLAIHAVVLGWAVLRRSAESAPPDPTDDAYHGHPAVAEFVGAGDAVDGLLDALVDMVMTGIRSSLEPS